MRGPAVRICTVTPRSNGLDQRLPRTSIGQEVRSRNAYGAARAIDQSLKENACLGASAMGGTGNNKAFHALRDRAKAKLS